MWFFPPRSLLSPTSPFAKLPSTACVRLKWEDLEAQKLCQSLFFVGVYPTSSISVVYSGLRIRRCGDSDRSGKHGRFGFGPAISSHSVETKANIVVLLTLKVSGCQTSFAEDLGVSFW